MSYRGGGLALRYRVSAPSAHVGQHQWSEFDDAVSPGPAVDDGVLEPARELATPAGRSPQYLHPRRHCPALLLGCGLSLLERRGILDVHLLVTDAFLRLQASTQEEQEVVGQDQKLILD